MTPIQIHGATHHLTPPANWQDTETETCGSLHVRVADNYFESAWKPSAEDLEVLNAGGSAVLSVYGGQPPVSLSVQEATSNEDIVAIAASMGIEVLEIVADVDHTGDPLNWIWIAHDKDPDIGKLVADMNALRDRLMALDMYRRPFVRWRERVAPPMSAEAAARVAAIKAMAATNRVATTGLEAALATVPPGCGLTITIEPSGSSRVVIRSPDYSAYSWEAGDQVTWEETGWSVCAAADDPASAVLDAVNLASVGIERLGALTIFSPAAVAEAAAAGVADTEARHPGWHFNEAERVFTFGTGHEVIHVFQAYDTCTYGQSLFLDAIDREAKQPFASMEDAMEDAEYWLGSAIADGYPMIAGRR